MVVDLGGGTGNFSLFLHEESKLANDIVVVDPSDTLLEEARSKKGPLKTVLADALQFVSLDDAAAEAAFGGRHYNKVGHLSVSLSARPAV